MSGGMRKLIGGYRLNKAVQKAFKLIIVWLEVQISTIEGDDELWMSLQEIRDDLRKLRNKLEER